MSVSSAFISLNIVFGWCVSHFPSCKVHLNWQHFTNTELQAESNWNTLGLWYRQLIFKFKKFHHVSADWGQGKFSSLNPRAILSVCYAMLCYTVPGSLSWKLGRPKVVLIIPHECRWLLNVNGSFARSDSWQFAFFFFKTRKYVLFLTQRDLYYPSYLLQSHQNLKLCTTEEIRKKEYTKYFH